MIDSPSNLQALRDEANHLANHLASMPTVAHGVLTRKALRVLLLDTGGELMAGGCLYNIVSKHLGAGVYDVRLTK